MDDMLSPPLARDSQAEGKGGTEEQAIVLPSVSHTAPHRTPCLAARYSVVQGTTLDGEQVNLDQNPEVSFTR